MNTRRNKQTIASILAGIIGILGVLLAAQPAFARSSDRYNNDSQYDKRKTDSRRHRRAPKRRARRDRARNDRYDRRDDRRSDRYDRRDNRRNRRSRRSRRSSRYNRDYRRNRRSRRDDRRSRRDDRRSRRDDRRSRRYDRRDDRRSDYRASRRRSRGDVFLSKRTKPKKKLSLGLPLALNILLPFAIGSWIAGDKLGIILGMSMQGGGILLTLIGFASSALMVIGGILSLAGFIAPIVTLPIHVSRHNKAIANTDRRSRYSFLRPTMALPTVYSTTVTAIRF